MASSYEFQVLGHYGQGWEVVTTGGTRAEAEQLLRDYRENEPDYAHRLRVRRVS